MLKSDCKISVCMITYNHAKYVRQAIDSVFAQVADFRIQLVVGDDASTDETQKHIASYESTPLVQYEPILRTKNLGMLPNFLDTLGRCEGEYIALLEGDDYWVDSSKLQKQIDFLDAHPDFSICFHPVKIQTEDGVIKSDDNQTSRDVSDIYDLARGNFMHTCSVVFRARLFESFPASFLKSTVGDYFLHMLNARYGKIKRLPDVMGVYRVHSGGVWSMQPNMDLKILTYLEAMADFFEPAVDVLLKERHKKIAAKSFFDRMDEDGFEDRLQRAVLFGADVFKVQLLEKLSSSGRCTGSGIIKKFVRALR